MKGCINISSNRLCYQLGGKMPFEGVNAPRGSIEGHQKHFKTFLFKKLKMGNGNACCNNNF